MNKINSIINIFIASILVSMFIVCMIIVNRSYNRAYEHIEAKNQIISELEYKLLNCRLSTILELEAQSDKKEAN
jgi:hypothetical protein